MSQNLAGKVLKALYAALFAALSGLSAVLVGETSFGDVTAGQWVTIALFSLSAGGGTFGLSGWAGPSNGPPMPPK